MTLGVRRMKLQTLPWCPVLLLLISVPLVTTSVIGATAQSTARIIDFQPQVSVHGSRIEPATIGMELQEIDSIVISKEGAVTLAFPDGSLRKLTGPAVITLSAKLQESQGLISKLTQGLASMLFPRGKEAAKARLAVRGSTLSEGTASTLPQLVYPPRGTTLRSAPDRFEWIPIEGATLYKVSLFDENHLVWSDRTQNSVIKLPADSLHLQTGKPFYWSVEAEIGRSALRSEEAAFDLLDSSSAQHLAQALRDAGDAQIDPRLRSLIRLGVYQSRNLLVDQYQEIDALLKASPDDPIILLAKAHVLESMSMYQEAANCYRQAIRP